MFNQSLKLCFLWIWIVLNYVILVVVCPQSVLFFINFVVFALFFIIYIYIFNLLYWKQRFSICNSYVSAINFVKIIGLNYQWYITHLFMIFFQIDVSLVLLLFFIVKHLRIFSIIAKSIVCKMPWSEIFNTPSQILMRKWNLYTVTQSLCTCY